MTLDEAIAGGRFAAAAAIQEAVVAAAPRDAAGRRLQAELLVLACRLEEARSLLDGFDSADPDWREFQRMLGALLQAERSRSTTPPSILPDPPPAHATNRRLALQSLQLDKPDEAVRLIDAADAAAPEVRGHLDGQEFDGLRDADDRFATVLEAFVDGAYCWFPWESLRSVVLDPVAVLLDHLYRPATIRLKSGVRFAVHLPLVYPETEGVLRTEFPTFTDYICADEGPTCCTGRKLLVIGHDADVPLEECRMIEIR